MQDDEAIISFIYLTLYLLQYLWSVVDPLWTLPWPIVKISTTRDGSPSRLEGGDREDLGRLAVLTRLKASACLIGWAGARGRAEMAIKVRCGVSRRLTGTLFTVG